ncbi:MAG: DMT family transporter [Mycobacterium sp.]
MGARRPAAPSTAALYLVPPVALVVALVWLGERPRPLELVGGLIGIAGVVLINRWRTSVTDPSGRQGNERLPFDRKRISLGSDSRRSKQVG